MGKDREKRSEDFAHRKFPCLCRAAEAAWRSGLITAALIGAALAVLCALRSGI